MNLVFKSHKSSDLFPDGKTIFQHSDDIGKYSFYTTQKDLNKKNPKFFIKFGIIKYFHDIGKHNPFFQIKKLSNVINKDFFYKESDYSNHSYLSAYILYSVRKYLQTKFNLNEHDIYQMMLIVASHHGSLKNITTKNMDEKIFFMNNDEIKRMQMFFSTAFPDKYINNFAGVIEEYIKKIPSFSDFNEKIIFNINEFISSLSKIKIILEKERIGLHKKTEFYFDTKMLFSCLIEGDKRDASQNTERHLTAKTTENFFRTLEDNINAFLKEKELETSELNVVRNAIRKESIIELEKHLDDDSKRTFMIQAPTASAKTIMGILLATTIMKKHDYKYSMIYTLPFLSILDQVDDILSNDLKIDNKNYLVHNSSKISQDLENVLKDSYENDNAAERLKLYKYADLTFDYPFVLTTLAELMETFFSNSNSKNMKFSNFAKKIIYIDEIQEMDACFYSFMIPLLDDFAKKFDCYILVGSATMPYLKINKNKALYEMFPTYNEPISLVSTEWFSNTVFNRYKMILLDKNPIVINELCDYIKEKNDPLLSFNVVMSTRTTAVDLYHKMKNTLDGKFYLLYNLKSPKHRIGLIREIKARTHELSDIYFKLKIKKDDLKIKKNELENELKKLDDLTFFKFKEKKFIKTKIIELETEIFTLNTSIAEDESYLKKNRIILITTHLIKAGVDIDFPISFSDISTFDNLVQIFGRLNRNNKFGYPCCGYVFCLADYNGKRKYTASYIIDAKSIKSYNKIDNYIDSIIEILAANSPIYEKDVLHLIEKHYETIFNNVSVGDYVYKNEEDKLIFSNMIDDINNMKFSEIGKFSYITQEIYDVTDFFFIPLNENNEIDYDMNVKTYEELKKLYDIIDNPDSVSKNDFFKNKDLFDIHMKDIQKDTVQFGYQKKYISQIENIKILGKISYVTFFANPKNHYNIDLGLTNMIQK